MSTLYAIVQKVDIYINYRYHSSFIALKFISWGVPVFKRHVHIYDIKMHL